MRSYLQLTVGSITTATDNAPLGRAFFDLLGRSDLDGALDRLGGDYAKQQFPEMPAGIGKAVPNGVRVDIATVTAGEHRVVIEAGVHATNAVGKVYDNKLVYVLDPADLPGYAQQVFDFYRDHPHFIRLTLWQYLERPGLMRSLPVVTDAEQRAGRIRDDLPASRLLDHIPALTTGNLANPNTWSDAERDALGRDLALLVSPR